MTPYDGHLFPVNDYWIRIWINFVSIEELKLLLNYLFLVGIEMKQIGCTVYNHIKNKRCMKMPVGFKMHKFVLT